MQIKNWIEYNNPPRRSSTIKRNFNKKKAINNKYNTQKLMLTTRLKSSLQENYLSSLHIIIMLLVLIDEQTPKRVWNR